jgi:hypothetical protein
MPRSLHRDPDGVAGALAMHLSLYCAVAACFALVLYYLMQPSRLPNPGMAALKRSPSTISYPELLRSERRAGAGNDRRRDATSARREAGNEESQSPEHEPESNASGASTATTPRYDPLRAGAILRRLSADVLTNGL